VKVVAVVLIRAYAGAEMAEFMIVTALGVAFRPETVTIMV
jgi:hypothetical protein